MNCTEEEFVALYKNRGLVQQAPSKLKELKSTIKTLQDSLFKAIREAQKYEVPTSVEDPAAEYRRILALPEVISLEILNKFLVIETKTLFCANPRTGLVHEIGRFKLEISLTEAHINWINTTRIVKAGQLGNLMAPHIFARSIVAGQPCLGNTAALFPALQANGEFAALIMMAIEFIQTLNSSDVLGATITLWPLADFHEDGSLKKRAQ